MKNNKKGLSSKVGKWVSEEAEGVGIRGYGEEACKLDSW
jgi:hypothetical protein